MSEILVKTNMMTQCVSNEQAVIKKLNNLASEIESIQRSLSFNVKSRARISNQLTTLTKATQSNAQHVLSLKNTLSNAASTYSATEKRISGNLTSAKAKVKSNTSVKGDTAEKNKSTPLWSWSDTWKLIGSAGIIGSVISTVGGIITNADTWREHPLKAILSTGKSISKVVEKVADASGSSFDWGKLIGLNRKVVDKSSVSFISSLKDEIGKYSFGNAKSTAEKVKVSAKWAGVALTAATTVYDNFTDKTENNSLGRKIAESIGETTVTVGESLLVGVAVGAACAGAPAVVIGGVTVIATWAIDKGFEALTGNNAAECLSDFFLDNGGKFFKGIGDKAKQVTDSVTGWWKKAFG